MEQCRHMPIKEYNKHVLCLELAASGFLGWRRWGRLPLTLLPLGCRDIIINDLSVVTTRSKIGILPSCNVQGNVVTLTKVALFCLCLRSLVSSAHILVECRVLLWVLFELWLSSCQACCIVRELLLFCLCPRHFSPGQRHLALSSSLDVHIFHHQR